MIGKIGLTLFGALTGGLAATICVVSYFGWDKSKSGQAIYMDPTRGDYIDLLLTLVTILLAAIGLAVTVGALVIGLVALKTLREIKSDASTAATSAAAEKISETMANELEPSVKDKVDEALPSALQDALISNELGHKILTEMAKRGELDEVLERVANRMQGGGLEEDPDYLAQYAAGEDNETQ